MLVPIQCFTCGEVIGDKWEDFKMYSETVKNCIRISIIGKIDDGKYKDFLQDEVTNNTGPYHSILDNPSKGLDFPISEDGKSVINEIMDNCLENIAEQPNGLEIIDTINQKILDHGMKNNLNETPEKIALDKLFATEHKDKGFTRWCCRMALLGTTDIPLS